MQKILIADDNKDFVELLESLLSHSGYETYVTYDGDAAINHLKDNNEYDLVITDVIMPGSDGFDLIKFVKAETTSKIIAVSGGGVFISSQSAVETIAGQVDASFKKPVKMDELLKCVQDVLQS